MNLDGSSDKVLVDLESGLSLATVLHILVVDDDLAVAQTIVQVLDLLGYKSIRCSNAMEALSQIESQHFDLVLTDYRMPEMTGLDLVSQLRRDECDIPVVMMTGYLATAERFSPEKLGVFSVLQKPINQAQLEKTVRDCLNEKVTRSGQVLNRIVS
jgi:CheY-like chemotaxis protein